MSELDELKMIAADLVGANVTSLTPAGHGGNSRVYKLEAGGKAFALKQYPTLANDPRDRLTTERHALELMRWHGIKSVPEWISGAEPFALMSWMHGSVITTPKDEDIDEIAVFLGTLDHISHKTPEEDMEPASEACLSGQVIISQLEARVANLMPHTKENPALMAFLSKAFLPTFTKRFMAAKNLPFFNNELPFNERTLIPADLGFHNVLRAPTGSLNFLDFEYFGWDDPVKLMSDFLLHPATPLTPGMKKKFHDHSCAIYGEAAKARFAAYYPLFGLRWALILLNEFLPDRWQARASATGATNWDEVKTAQLAKAEAMVKMSETFQ